MGPNRMDSAPLHMGFQNNPDNRDNQENPDYLNFLIFREVYVTHVAAGEEFLVEGEGCVEIVGSLTSETELQIVAEQFLIHRVNAVLDDFLCLLNGVFATKIGHALVCDEDIDRVLRMVKVRNHRHDVGNLSTLGD